MLSGQHTGQITHQWLYELLRSIKHEWLSNRALYPHRDKLIWFKFEWFSMNCSTAASANLCTAFVCENVMKSFIEWVQTHNFRHGCISAALSSMEVLFLTWCWFFCSALHIHLCKVYISLCISLSCTLTLSIYLTLSALSSAPATSQIPPTRDDNIWLWQKVCGDRLGWNACPQLVQGKNRLKLKVCYWCAQIKSVVKAFYVKEIQPPVGLTIYALQWE